MARRNRLVNDLTAYPAITEAVLSGDNEKNGETDVKVGTMRSGSCFGDRICMPIVPENALVPTT